MIVLKGFVLSSYLCAILGSCWGHYLVAMLGLCWTPKNLKLISCCNCFQIRVRAQNDSKPSVQVDFWVWYSLVQGFNFTSCN